MDASRRSRHGNAYFTGLGPVKRIVLFDTLVSTMSEDEVLAVLAHEIGHERRHHVRKGLALSIVLGLAGFWVLSLAGAVGGALPGLRLRQCEQPRHPRGALPRLGPVHVRRPAARLLLVAPARARGLLFASFFLRCGTCLYPFLKLVLLSIH